MHAPYNLFINLVHLMSNKYHALRFLVFYKKIKDILFVKTVDK